MNSHRLTRTLLALAVAAMGFVDLLSAVFSHSAERLRAIRHLIPTDVLPVNDVLTVSRTYGFLAGALLLATAWGLRNGKRRAFVTAAFLTAASVPLNLFKAFDFEEATAATALLFVLGISGHAFRVKSRDFSFRAMRSVALWVLAGILVYAIGGCWLLELQVAHEHSLRRAALEAVYQISGIGEPGLHISPALREHDVVVRWFLDSIAVMSVTLLVGLALALLRPAAHQGRQRAEAQRAAELVRQYGDSPVAAFAVGPDVDYFFSPNRRAVIAYRFEYDTLLAIGDPIGPPEEIPPLLRAFQEFCREHDWQFAFYQALPEHLEWYRRQGWRAVHIGEDPVLWTGQFSLEGAAVGTVRRAVRKLERAGLVALMYVPGEAPFDPAHDPHGLLPQLSEISTAWLRGHQGGEKTFCMGRFEPHKLNEAWLAVAWNPESRRVEGFCTWVPIWARRGWAIDLMRRREDSPTGTMEFLVVKSLEKARERGDAMLSLALSALAKVHPEGPSAEAPAGAPVAPALPPGAITDDPAREFLMERLARFYDFKGLFRWKSKFAPAFEDRYLIYPDAMALPRIARALLAAQSPGGLRSYFRKLA
jgi:phosphatidylglycerol lysyltransferase